MLDKYKELFEIYLKVCKSKYDFNKPYDNLENCCETCERFAWELSGMLALLERAGEITSVEMEKENQRIHEKFSTIKLYNAYMEKGQVMVFGK